jgi:two-component system, LytTR family, response regulator
MKTILIDDERMSLELLTIKLQKIAPELQIVASYQKPEEAIVGIRQHKPDVIFLDIEMPNMNGFDVLDQFEHHDFDVIFTTAYSQYAIDAIRQSAIDFLLKPIREIELSNAIERLKQKRQAINQPSHAFLQAQFNKIAIPSSKGIVFVPVQNIVRLESDSNYTVFYLTNRQKLIASRTLKDFEALLVPTGFVRIHRSSMINLTHLQEYIRGEGGTVLMVDGSEIEVSRREKPTLMARIGL